MERRPGSRTAFCEVAAVVIIVMVLGVTVTPVTGRWRRAADQQCQLNLKALGAAFAMYANDHDGRYPFMGNGNRPAGKRESWAALLLPYVKDTRPFECPSRPDWRTGPMDGWLGILPGGYMGVMTDWGRWEQIQFPHIPQPRCEGPLGVDYADNPRLRTEVEDPTGTVLVLDSLRPRMSSMCLAPLTCALHGYPYSDSVDRNWCDTSHAELCRHNDGVNLLYCDGHVGWLRGYDVKPGLFTIAKDD